MRDARHRYIVNLTPEATFKNAATNQASFKEWQTAAQAGDANAALTRMVRRFDTRATQLGLVLDIEPADQAIPAHWDFGRVEQLLCHRMVRRRPGCAGTGAPPYAGTAAA